LPPCQGMSVWVFITKELPRSFHPGSNSELHKIGDVARFLAAIMNGGEVDGVRILDEATVESMLSPQIPDVDETQGVWWYLLDIAARSTWGHNGQDDGVATDMYLDAAAGIGVVLLMNTDWSDASTEAAFAIELRLFSEGEAM
jgi:CubicO group peptidase (beta-lactamase class C family)